jgi:hypothetical protein
VRAQVITEDGLIEWLARLVGTRVRMGVDQAREQPAFGGQLGSADRIIGPPVTVREQLNDIAVGQGDPADPQNSHQTALTAAPAARKGSYPGCPRATKTACSGRAMGHWGAPDSNWP